MRLNITKRQNRQNRKTQTRTAGMSPRKMKDIRSQIIRVCLLNGCPSGAIGNAISSAAKGISIMGIAAVKANITRGN